MEDNGRSKEDGVLWTGGGRGLCLYLINLVMANAIVPVLIIGNGRHGSKLVCPKI